MESEGVKIIQIRGKVIKREPNGVTCIMCLDEESRYTETRFFPTSSNPFDIGHLFDEIEGDDFLYVTQTKPGEMIVGIYKDWDPIPDLFKED